MFCSLYQTVFLRSSLIQLCILYLQKSFPSLLSLPLLCLYVPFCVWLHNHNLLPQNVTETLWISFGLENQQVIIGFYRGFKNVINLLDTLIVDEGSQSLWIVICWITCLFFLTELLHLLLSIQALLGFFCPVYWAYWCVCVLNSSIQVLFFNYSITLIYIFQMYCFISTFFRKGIFSRLH